MATYLVVWTIELEADSALEAATVAREIQQDPDSLATEFEVWEGTICTLVDFEKNFPFTPLTVFELVVP